MFFLFPRKIFCLFGCFLCSTEKNGSQRQKLLPKIHITSCRQRNNFSAVSLTSVLSVTHKSAQKIFSVLVFRLPKRQNKTNSGENHYDSTKENLPFQRRHSHNRTEYPPNRRADCFKLGKNANDPFHPRFILCLSMFVQRHLLSHRQFKTVFGSL